MRRKPSTLPQLSVLVVVYRRDCVVRCSGSTLSRSSSCVLKTFYERATTATCDRFWTKKETENVIKTIYSRINNIYIKKERFYFIFYFSRTNCDCFLPPPPSSFSRSYFSRITLVTSVLLPTLVLFFSRASTVSRTRLVEII